MDKRIAPKRKPVTKDEKLDDALDDTFPASDPPAMTEPVEHVGKPKKDSDTEPSKRPGQAN